MGRTLYCDILTPIKFKHIRGAKLTVHADLSDSRCIHYIKIEEYLLLANMHLNVNQGDSI
jgi:hypothetical protein